MFEILGAGALAGFCAKVVDDIIDRRLRVPSYLPILLALAYGLLLGWLSGPAGLSSLFIALALASLLSGKIDHPYHLLGAAAFALVILLTPLGGFSPWWFALFLTSGLLDELELGRGKLLERLNEERVWTPLAALLGTAFFGLPLLFLLVLLLFDLSFRFGGWVVSLEYPAHAPQTAPAKPKRKRK
ncbi:Uncharacterised protein [uncultured archaeon]|nr:Uncharacterised protein [uncultured archaeon]